MRFGHWVKCILKISEIFKIHLTLLNFFLEKKRNSKEPSNTEFTIKLIFVHLLKKIKIWVDERLRWNKSEYNNLEKIRLPCNRIWVKS